MWKGGLCKAPIYCMVNKASWGLLPKSFNTSFATAECPNCKYVRKIWIIWIFKKRKNLSIITKKRKLLNPKLRENTGHFSIRVKIFCDKQHGKISWICNYGKHCFHLKNNCAREEKHGLDTSYKLPRGGVREPTFFSPHPQGVRHETRGWDQ